MQADSCLSVTTLVVPVICIMQSMCSAVSSLYADVIEQRPISSDVTSVDTVTQWREDWLSASVVSTLLLLTDPTIRSQVSISLVIHGL